MSEVKRRVLLVDDEPDIVKMIRKQLELEGFDVVVAVDGPEALEKAKAERPDLIILDVMLPHASGFEVCDKLKKDERYHDIPIIIYTGKGKPGDDQIVKELGADAYVTKVEGKAMLMEKVHALLGDSPKSATS